MIRAAALAAALVAAPLLPQCGGGPGPEPCPASVNITVGQNPPCVVSAGTVVNVFFPSSWRILRVANWMFAHGGTLHGGPGAWWAQDVDTW